MKKTFGRRAFENLLALMILLCFLASLVVYIRPNYKEGQYYLTHSNKGVLVVTCDDDYTAQFNWISSFLNNGRLLTVHTAFDGSRFVTGDPYVFSVIIPEYREVLYFADYWNDEKDFDPGSVFLAEYPGGEDQFLKDITSWYDFENLINALDEFYEDYNDFCIPPPKFIGTPA